MQRTLRQDEAEPFPGEKMVFVQRTICGRARVMQTTRFRGLRRFPRGEKYLKGAYQGV
jgi:hypothetical protein